MKPNDEDGKLPTPARPFRALIISGSDRRRYNRPGADSEAGALMIRMAERLPQEWEGREAGAMGLNGDLTLRPKEGGGEKLREG